MTQTFGIEAHPDAGAGGQNGAPQTPSARFLILIDSASGGRRVAKVMLADHSLEAEFDASAPEVQLMCRGLEPQGAATGAEWDQALAGHADEERRSAEVYRLGT